MSVVDEDGFRYNVGIVVVNASKEVLIANRSHKHQAWQFPQGGMKKNETTTQAMYRELEEEIGIDSDAVSLLKESDHWYSYRLPIGYWRLNSTPLVVGQKQKWFLLQLIADDDAIQLDRSKKPEFDEWRWASYWEPVECIIDFKKEVYQQVLTEFEPLLTLVKHKTDNG